MQFHIILVEPARAENVGAAARAMKTMGFGELRIVASQVHQQPAARWVAHGSGDVLDAVKTFPTLAEALADSDFTIATTARSRARFRYYCTPAELLGVMREKQRWIGTAALVFGREDSGLTNEELELADILTGVPMKADYPSLNLGQAVMVYCYQLAELMQVRPDEHTPPPSGPLSALRQRLDKLLINLAVEDDEKLRDWIHQRLGRLEQRDTAMLHMLLHDVEKAISKEDSGK
ncbi:MULTISPECIES: tRNA/rRNA methyltransferase [unclassified Brenneria]|uniref:tRNA/rRNA methyltransferase n=1 Tax=unclassified Brenneria TaxID=2634434 RepID=UPI001552F6A8|nr:MULTISPECIES: tRNA/rRNA methyltransferase [unclassified Brenneria]MBJ7222789.1 tRNA/rRNA methyltransferase [Brenneria sp. L3-3C-1]MEE3644033.1 tRNA/rRNA methyltransferase [Brenneria sp. L3_3C_1]MEE3651865.1 tRNA/rRNA methyltransferase [Brenneria sp. HEZEL_4_2_4]NPD01825.1 tRNA/rRNA methyltransferase [Brenneria sp. hezel4-2-4]